jgi:hypothetical protein
MPEFPNLPFTKVSSDKRNAFLYLFNFERSAFFPGFIHELCDAGVLEKFSQLALTSAEGWGFDRAEIQIAPDQSVVAFQVNFGAGKAAVERGFRRWLVRDKERFRKESRKKAGARAKANPRAKLKDLAATRLLALHDFNAVEASRWARENQPRDGAGRSIRWFRSRSGAKPHSPPFKDLRDWNAAELRFHDYVEALLV